jgi:hypothetical protein
MKMKDELNRGEINCLENVMTLAPHIHTRFGSLTLYLEAIESREVVLDFIEYIC